MKAFLGVSYRSATRAMKENIAVMQLADYRRPPEWIASKSAAVRRVGRQPRKNALSAIRSAACQSMASQVVSFAIVLSCASTCVGAGMPHVRASGVPSFVVEKRAARAESGATVKLAAQVLRRAGTCKAHAR